MFRLDPSSYNEVDGIIKKKNINLLDEFIQSPFYESLEYCIRSFNLAPESDSDIQFFLDFTFEYQQKKQPSVDGFLELWELKKDKLSIVAPEAENAVRIMTIHKAKGLEFPVVIFPCDVDIYMSVCWPLGKHISCLTTSNLISLIPLL